MPRLVLILLAALLWFGNLEHRPLLDPDEGRYAEIPREMVATGDWVTPRLNGIKYFEKPPLQYWMTALAYEVFGAHQWTARLWTALCGFLGILLVGWTGSRLFGAASGWNSALVLGSSLGYVAAGQINTLDMGVTWFLTLALCGFLLAQEAGATPRARLGWMMVAWAAAGLAVLTKGLIGLVLPVLALGAYIVIHWDWKLLRRLYLGRGFLVLIAVTAPWFIAVSLRNPEFPNFFFVHEHFQRFLTQTHQRYQPWWWFVPVLLVGMLPWVLSAAGGLAKAWGGDRAGSDAFRPRRFLLLWAATIFLFFSASSSKLHAYILPMFPALALLAGEFLAALNGRQRTWQAAPGAALGLALAGVGLYAAFAGGMRPEVRAYAPWVIAAGAVGLTGAMAAAYSARRGASGSGLTALAAGGMVSALLLLGGFDRLATHRSGKELAAAMAPLLGPGVPIYSVGTYEQTIPFYLQRTVTLVGDRSELGFGLDQEPEKWVPDIMRFPELWTGAPHALAVMTPFVYQTFFEKGVPMEIVARNRDYVVVRKP